MASSEDKAAMAPSATASWQDAATAFLDATKLDIAPAIKAAEQINAFLIKISGERKDIRGSIKVEGNIMTGSLHIRGGWFHIGILAQEGEENKFSLRVAGAMGDWMGAIYEISFQTPDQLWGSDKLGQIIYFKTH